MKAYVNKDSQSASSGNGTEKRKQAAGKLRILIYASLLFQGKDWCQIMPVNTYVSILRISFRGDLAKCVTEWNTVYCGEGSSDCKLTQYIPAIFCRRCILRPSYPLVSWGRNQLKSQINCLCDKYEFIDYGQIDSSSMLQYWSEQERAKKTWGGGTQHPDALPTTQAKSKSSHPDDRWPFLWGTLMVHLL